MIFIDTSALHALHVSNDLNHESALKVKRALSKKKHGQSITTNYILDETYTLLRISVGVKNSIKIGELIRNSKILKVIWIDPSIETLAWNLFCNYSDKNFSFTDCMSFIIMKELNIRDAFTYDEHFKQMNFNMIMR